MAFLSVNEQEKVLNQQKVSVKKPDNKLSKCALCKQKKNNTISVGKVAGNIRIEKTLVKRKQILLKTIRAQKKLSSNQIAKLETANQNFAPKFCSTCLQKYASPNFSKSARISYADGRILWSPSLSLTLTFSIQCQKNSLESAK